VRVFFVLVSALIVFTSLVAQAGEPEVICTNPKFGPPGAGDTIACYSQAGCARARSLGGEAITDYDAASAPFALARGKIGAIITSDKKLIETAKANGAACQP
jgi:hypothetical protein